MLRRIVYGLVGCCVVALLVISCTHSDKKERWADEAQNVYSQARVYINKGHNAYAMELLAEAEELAAKSDDHALKAAIGETMARQFRRDNHFRYSAYLFAEATRNYQQADEMRSALQTAMGAAYDYYRQNKVEKSDEYWDMAERYAAELNDTTALLFLHRVRLSRLYFERRYDEALNELHESTAKYAHGVVPKDYYLLISMLYLRLGKADSAALYVQPRLTDTEGPLQRERLYDESRSQWELYSNYLAGEFYAAQRDYEQAYRRKSRALVISDSTYRAEKIHPSALSAYIRKKDADLRRDNEHLQTRSTLYLILIIVTALLLLFVILWLVARRQRQLALYDQLLTRYRITTSELKAFYDRESEANKKPPTDDRPQIDPEVVERRVAFLSSLMDMVVSSSHDKELFYRKVEQLLLPSESGGVQWMFEDLLNLRYDWVVAYLRERYPQLTDREVCIYCMVCLEMPKSAICLALNISTKTYYNLRNIVRNKLSINNADCTFIDHLVRLHTEMRASKQAKTASGNEKVIKNL